MSRAIRNRLSKLEGIRVGETGYENLSDAALDDAIVKALESLFDNPSELSAALIDEEDGPAVRGAVEWLTATGHANAQGWAKALG